MKETERLTLRMALRMLGHPYKAKDVKRLRDRLRQRERRNGIVILSGKPNKVTIRDLRKHVPSLFVEFENVFERRALELLRKVAKKARNTDSTDD